MSYSLELSTFIFFYFFVFIYLFFSLICFYFLFFYSFSFFHFLNSFCYCFYLFFSFFIHFHHFSFHLLFQVLNLMIQTYTIFIFHYIKKYTFPCNTRLKTRVIKSKFEVLKFSLVKFSKYIYFPCIMYSWSSTRKMRGYFATRSTHYESSQIQPRRFFSFSMKYTIFYMY